MMVTDTNVISSPCNPKCAGRKKIEFTEAMWKEFEQLCWLQCTMDEMCGWFHITKKTLIRRVHEHFGVNFSTIFRKKRIGGKISLRKNLWRLGEKNPAAAIFLAKNYLGMSDKMDVDNSGGGSVTHAVSISVVDDKTRRIVKEIMNGKGPKNGKG